MKQYRMIKTLCCIVVLLGCMVLPAVPVTHAGRTVRVRFQDPVNCKVEQGCYNRNNLQEIIQLLTNEPGYDPNDPPTLEVSGQFAEYDISTSTQIVITRSIRLIAVREGGKPVVLDGEDFYRPIRIIAPTNGEPFKVTIEGFTIKNGNASLTDPSAIRYLGGAMYIENAPSSVIVRDNVFERNIAGDTANSDPFGGALFIRGGAPQIHNNVFVYNRAANSRNNQCCPRRGHGGAIAAFDSAVVITNNRFTSNVAGARQGIAGAIYLNGSSGTGPVVSGNAIFGNQASIDTNASPNIGGGMYVYNVPNLRITNNVIAYNRDVEGAAGILLDGSSASIDHNTFAYNIGVGLRVRFVSQVTAANNLFSGQSGTAVVADASGAVVDLQTTFFYQNAATSEGVNNGVVTEQDTINGFDPLFENAGRYNFHLLANSPARDAGIATTISTDIDGDPRPVNDAADIGADEFMYKVGLPLASN
jgi:hypothetical protein